MKLPILPRTLLFGLIATASSVSVLSAACGGDCACSVTPEIAATESGSLILSSQTQALLIAQLADEGLAASVYRELGDHFPLHPFQNIPRAEDTHAAALKSLLTSAGIDASTGSASAAATTERTQLISQGSQSEIDALKVGALIEERDITGLRKLATDIVEPEVVSVIQQLETGSHHHLNAFVRNLRQRGVTYTPQVLSQTDFDAIIEEGSPGQAHGQGHAMNRQNG